MWIVHIDSWNYADPAKIIDLIPEDILPYVVFNISLSINWDPDNKKWLMVKDGYETAKSWIRTCAEKGVWTMIQPSSGGQSHFPDYEADDDLEDTIYAEFFRDYPNFIGYNYCEQFRMQNGLPVKSGTAILRHCSNCVTNTAAILISAGAPMNGAQVSIPSPCSKRFPNGKQPADSIHRTIFWKKNLLS